MATLGRERGIVTLLYPDANARGRKSGMESGVRGYDEMTGSAKASASRRRRDRYPRRNHRLRFELEAGFRKDDLIESVNGKAVDTPETFRKLVRTGIIDTKARFVLKRGEEAVKVEVQFPLDCLAPKKG
jgi:hypothetical protein